MNISDHQLQAAIQVVRIIDENGNAGEDARTSYRLRPSQGQHRSADLLAAEDILLNADLLAIDENGRIRPNARLRVVASLDDDDALVFLRRVLLRHSDSSRNIETGLIGELEVVRRCREELLNLSRPDLSTSVQQVSILDDTLGYDVFAPVILGSPRHLEVKTSASAVADTFDFFISRNEFDTGRRDPSWALVACNRADRSTVDVVGWCRAQTLYPYVPEDRSGRWTEAQLRIPTTALFDGIPPSV